MQGRGTYLEIQLSPGKSIVKLRAPDRRGWRAGGRIHASVLFSFPSSLNTKPFAEMVKQKPSPPGWGSSPRPQRVPGHPRACQPLATLTPCPLSLLSPGGSRWFLKSGQALAALLSLRRVFWVTWQVSDIPSGSSWAQCWRWGGGPSPRTSALRRTRRLCLLQGPCPLSTSR